MKFKFVQKLKQLWQVTRKPTLRNWLELPSDLMVNILQRVGAVDILLNVQKVCTAWREICKEPSMWRVIYINRFKSQFSISVCREMCKHIVDRSQGQSLDLTLVDVCNKELLQYVLDRSSQLRRLEIKVGFWEMCEFSGEALKKSSLLEELSFLEIYVSQEDVEAIGRYCPLLKTLKLNLQPYGVCSRDDVLALAIGKNLPELTHLELIRNNITNIGLQAILDGRCHLESLDLRWCWKVDLNGDLGKRCSQQITHLKTLPHGYF